MQNHVIEHEQSVSIKLLTEVYGLEKEDFRLRGKVKQKLLQEFKDELLYVTVSNNEAQIVVSKKVLTNVQASTFINENKEFVLEEAAKIIKSDVLDLVQSSPRLPWPPIFESFLSKERQPLGTRKKFLLNLLHSTDHSPGEEVNRYVESFLQDIFHAVSKGDFLHSITVLKKPINILAKYLRTFM